MREDKEREVRERQTEREEKEAAIEELVTRMRQEEERYEALQRERELAGCTATEAEREGAASIAMFEESIGELASLFEQLQQHTRRALSQQAAAQSEQEGRWQGQLAKERQQRCLQEQQLVQQQQQASELKALWLLKRAGKWRMLR